MATPVISEHVYGTHRASVEAYRLFRGQNFLVVKGLAPDEEVAEIIRHNDGE